MRQASSPETFVLRVEALLRRLGVDPESFSFLVFTGGLGDEFLRFVRERGAVHPRLLPDGWANEDHAAAGPPLGLGEFAFDGGRAYLYADLVSEPFGPGLFAALAAPRGPALERLRGEFLAARSRGFEGTRFLYRNCRWTRFEPEAAGWGDIVLDPDFVADFRGNLDHFLGAREFFDRNRLPYRRGFLLCGPPGNGKTLLLRVLAREYPEVAFAVFAEGQARPDDDDLDAFFDDCPLGPSIPRVVVFEDLDSIFGEHRVSLSHFLNRVDGLKPLAGTLLLATTNRPEVIDPGLLRRPSRFDRVWRLGDPPYALRRSYLRRLIGEEAGRLRDAIDRTAREAEGFSFAMVREIFLTAGVLAHAAKSPRVEPEQLLEALARLREQDALTRRPADRTPEALGFRTGFGEGKGEEPEISEAGVPPGGGRPGGRSDAPLATGR